MNTTSPTWAGDVELVELSLATTRDARVRWVAKALVDVRAAGAAAAPRGKRKAYERAGSYGSLSSWLDERDDFIASSLDRLCRDLAAQIVSDLTVKLEPGVAPR